MSCKAEQVGTDDDGSGDACDDDGVEGAFDVFLNDPAESLDSDADGIGDNADGDDIANNALELSKSTFCSQG